MNRPHPASDVLAIGSNHALSVNGSAPPRAEEGRLRCRSTAAWSPDSVGRTDDDRRRLEERRSRRCWPGRMLAAAPHPRVRGDGARARRRRTRARTRALQHRPGGRRGRLDRRPALHATRVNGSHRGHHQFLAKALTHVSGGIRSTWPPSSPPRSRRCCSARSPRSSASRRATAAAAAARCTCSGSRPARSAPTRSSAAARRWRRATPGRRSTPDTDRPHDQLLRRRREPDRLGAGDA